MNIVLNELKVLCDTILRRIEYSNISKIYISEDYYWEVFFEDACTSKNPLKPVMGSLFDDWEWLEKVLSKENPLTGIDFFRLGNIITAIGHEFDKPPHKPDTIDLQIKIADIKLLFDLIFTGAKKENINLETVDTCFDKYWRVNLASIYDIYISGYPPVDLQPLPNNIAALTEHIQSSSKLDIGDFEQIGVLFKALGYSPDSALFMFIDSNHDEE